MGRGGRNVTIKEKLHPYQMTIKQYIALQYTYPNTSGAWVVHKDISYFIIKFYSS